MARKKTRKFAGGGTLEAASDEIVVRGKRGPSMMDELSNFNLSRIGGGSGMGGGLGTGMVGVADSQRITDLGPAPMPASKGRMAVMPAVVRQGPSSLGNLMGDKGAKAYGATFRGGFAKGGKVTPAEAVHMHEKNMHKGKKPTKFAKGGSAASKRADGCATKGKTKGRFV
jgi:hypothetical protein